MFVCLFSELLAFWQYLGESRRPRCHIAFGKCKQETEQGLWGQPDVTKSAPPNSSGTQGGLLKVSELPCIDL